MIIDRAKASISQKINLGGYETRDYQFGLEASLSEGENKEAVEKELREICSGFVEKYYKRIKFGEADPRIEKIETMTRDNIEEVKALIKDDVNLYKLFNDKRIALG